MKMKHRRFRMKKLRTISLKDGWSEVDGYVSIRPKPKPAAPLPDGSRPMVSESGDFAYFSGEKCWTCILSDTEQKLVKAIAENEAWQIDWEVAFAAVWPKDSPVEKPLRDLASSINRKLKEREFPVRLSVSDGYAKIMRNPGI